MADLMAIVSKAVFEKEAGKSPAVGSRLGMDRYVSANKNLEPLAKDGGGKLYLVTVRPPDEKLWLVAVLDQRKFGKGAWIAKASTTPITDISKLRSKLKFESGKGITAAAGALGMSLQTPRALTAADTKLLDAAIGSGGAVADASPLAAAAAATPGPKPGRFDKTLPPAAPGVAPEGDRTSSLLAAVLADPANLDARRVYADELATHNDPRGEFIHLDLALAGRVAIRKREQLSQRRAELVKLHGKTWWPYKGEHKVHAGFVYAIAGSFATVNSAAAKLFASEPVTEVTIQDGEEDTIEKLVKAKWLSKVKHLIVRGELGDDGFAALCGSAGVAQLEALNITANGISGEGLASLGENLPCCRSLVLTANPIGDEGLGNLRMWQALSKVEKLYLSGCEISAEGLGELLEGVTFSALEKLCLKNNELGDIGPVIAKHAKNLPALRHLELISSALEGADVRAIAKAKLPNLVRIDARRNDDVEDSSDPRVRIGR